MTLNEEKCPDGQYYCNDSKKCKPIPKGHHVMPDGKLMKGEKHSMNEVAPPTKKHERMVKHIKKSYGKKGGLSDEEKSIAYATAWKNYNKKESFGFEIDKGGHKKASKKAKMRNLAKGNTNPNEKAAAEKKAGGPKLYGEGKLTHLTRASVLGASDDPKDQDKAREIKTRFDYESLKKQIGKKKKPMKPAVQKEMTYQEAIDAGWEMTGEGIWWPPQPENVEEKISFAMFKKKAAEKKPEKAMDAGAKAKRKLARKAHAKYVSGSEDNVPDDIRDHKEYAE